MPEWDSSLPDTEIPEDDVKQIFDIDLAGDAAEGTQREAEIFSDEVGGEFLMFHMKHPLERGDADLEGDAVALSGDERRWPGEAIGCGPGQRGFKRAEAGAAAGGDG